MLWRFSTVLCVSLLAFSCVGIASATSWYVLPIGVPSGGSASYAYNMNANGEIVGGTGAPNAGTAFTWQNGVMTSLGVPAGFSTSDAYGINSAGAVVGVGVNASTYRFQGLYYSQGQWTALGANTVSAQKIYDDGTIVGVGGSNGQLGSGWVLTGGPGGTYSSQGMGAGGVYAKGANGTYVGGWVTGDGAGVASWYNAGTPLPTYPDASTIGDGSTGGFFGVSSDGNTLVGTEGNGTDQAVIYNVATAAFTNVTSTITSSYRGLDADSTYFGTNDGFYAINGTDAVGGMTFKNKSTGASYRKYANGTNIPAGQHAVMYDTSTSTFTDLNSLINSTNVDSAGGSWVLENAQAMVTVGNIPDALGQSHAGETWIVGYGLYTLNSVTTTEGFIMSPTLYTPYSPTPEPSTLVLTASCLCGLLAYAWRKRK